MASGENGDRESDGGEDERVDRSVREVGALGVLPGGDTRKPHSVLRIKLNYSILRLNFSISSGIFTKISLNFPNFLQSSLSLDILEHVREIPTKFHLNFGEK